MDAAERRDRIVEYLRIKPISHGQVHTFQIAIPKSEDLEISSERRENLERSLSQQGSNLIPLIVRRTEAYSEEQEYEVVYGADWWDVAEKLGIEKLWVWVFDMTDEQAAAAKEEMQQLLGSSDSSPVVVRPPSEETESIKPILQKLDKLSETETTTLDSSRLTNLELLIQNQLNEFKLQLAQERQRVDDKFKEFTNQISQGSDALNIPQGSDALYLLNTLKKEDLSVKLQRSRIPTADKIAQAIVDARRSKKPKPEFEDYRDVVKSVKNLGEKRILTIIDEWGRS